MENAGSPLDAEYPEALLAMLGSLESLGGWQELPPSTSRVLEVVIPSQFSPAPEVMAKQVDLLEKFLFQYMQGDAFAIERVVAVQSNALQAQFSSTISSMDEKAQSIPHQDHTNDWMYQHFLHYASHFQNTITPTITNHFSTALPMINPSQNGNCDVINKGYSVLVPVLYGCSAQKATAIAANGFEEQNGEYGQGIYTTTDTESAYQQAKKHNQRDHTASLILAWAVFSNLTTNVNSNDPAHDAKYTVLEHQHQLLNGHTTAKRRQGVLVLSKPAQLLPMYILSIRPLSSFPFPHLELSLRLGWKQFWNYQTDDALALSAKLAAQEPSCGMAFLLHGRCLKRQLKHDEGEKSLKVAISVLTKYINQNPDDMVAYKTRALAYYLLARDSDSYNDAAKAIEVNRFDASAYLVRGETCRMMSNYEQALDDCSKAIELNPNFPNAYFTRAETNRMKGKYAESVNDATKAIQLNPSYARAYRVRGDSYRLLNKYDQALEDSTKAVELDPSYANAFWTRAESYRNLGYLDECIQDATTAIDLNPNDAFVYETRGFAYKLKGMMQEARHDLKHALKLKPGEDFARHHLDDIPDREKRWIALKEEANATTKGNSCQLSDNWICSEEIYYITKVILSPEITTLHLQDNEIGDLGARMLCTNTNITWLNLENNDITDSGASHLANSTTLTSLELGCNSIGDEGAISFSRNSTLLTLNLNSNYVGVTGAKSFYHSTTITELDVRECAVDPEVLAEIDEHVKKNKMVLKELTSRFSTVVKLLAMIRSKKLASLRASANMVAL